ncbi:MAG TPA: DUF2399 domain-containing protein [Candidatus Tetragenococcus pullicola]|nr:DUF2399 domain-containing protein [Candidatus Tetragenococcus pullicola]
MSETIEAKQYFKAPIFKQVAKELWRRYYKTSSFGRSMGLNRFETSDLEPLRIFLGVSLVDWKTKKTITVAQFQQALNESIFHLDIADFILLVTKRSLVLQEEEQALKKQAFQDFCQTIEQISPIFLENLSIKQLQHWHEQKVNVAVFEKVAQGLENLPTEYTRLPVFAYQITGNPHAFDETTQTGQLFMQVLAGQADLSTSEKELSKTEEKHAVLSEAYLLKDDIKNNVSLRGLLAKKGQRWDGLWQQACQENTSWNVPLKEVLSVEKLQPYQGNSVFIIENSGIYSILLEEFPRATFVCSSGQFNYTVWTLLRKLARSNVSIYYCGDLDPEGLDMAQRLLDSFPERLKTIGMTPDFFDKGKTTKEISEPRLKKMNRLTDPNLQLVAEQIRTTNMVAYQEGTIPELIQTIEEILYNETNTRGSEAFVDV